MPLFQRPPASAAELDRCAPLDVPPDQVLELDEATWYARIYRGDDVPQLTVRAVATGSFIGLFLAVTNLYIGLKTGLGFGVAITACILAHAFWNTLLKARLAKTPMTILETNCMQSTASAAGYSTGGTIISAICAMLMIQGTHLDWWVLVLWTFGLATLGTVLAIPMKRSMINRERLKFPSGTAAAVTLQSLYSRGETATRKARALLWAALAGAIFPLLLELEVMTRWVFDQASNSLTQVHHALLPATTKLFDAIGLPVPGAHLQGGQLVENLPSHWTMVVDHNPVLIAAGALVGLRVCLYMVVGSLALIYVVGPLGYEAEWVTPAGDAVRAASAPWKAWKEIGIWLGVPLLVASALLSFGLHGKAIVRALRGLASGAVGVEDAELVRRTEVPVSWFLWGTLLAGSGLAVLAHLFFEIPLHYGALAVALTFFLALVVSRVTGEADVTPTGAMGKVMQLTYGVLLPQSISANLMTASITSGAAASSADLLNDLKSGYLLGANPRRQFVAQFLGIFTGTAAVVAGFYLLVPDATVLTGVGDTPPQFPAPAAQQWKAVANLFATGLENMHPAHREAIVWGLTLGVLLVTLEQLLPRHKSVLPSATGLGLGLILPFQYPLSLFVGAAIGAIWTHRSARTADDYLVPVAAGIIAGVSTMGVVVATLNNLILMH